jgi:hypothetical protein
LVKQTQNSRCLQKTAGVFFGLIFWILLPSTFAFAQNFVAPQGYCLTGFKPLATNDQLTDTFFIPKKNVTSVSQPMIQPEISQWLTEHHWQAGYSYWQKSRLCGSGLNANNNPLCVLAAKMPQPPQTVCGSAQDGYEFLVMHRHIMQSMKSLWPRLDDQFASWKKFPKIEDYPLVLQDKVHAWPDAILRAAEAMDTLTKLPREKILAKWPSEGDLGRWLQCGNLSGGTSVNALYPALNTNGINVGGENQVNSPLNMDFYLFWKIHGWVDRVWEKYRKITGKSPFAPELQADLIKQCQIHYFWTQQNLNFLTSPVNNTQPTPLFLNGELNPAYRQTVRMLAEVVDIKEPIRGNLFIQVQPGLVGVKPIWVVAQLSNAEIHLGAHYVFIGAVKPINEAGLSDDLKKRINSQTLLLVESVQSVK